MTDELLKTKKIGPKFFGRHTLTIQKTLFYDEVMQFFVLKMSIGKYRIKYIEFK